MLLRLSITLNNKEGAMDTNRDPERDETSVQIGRALTEFRTDLEKIIRSGEPGDGDTIRDVPRPILERIVMTINRVLLDRNALGDALVKAKSTAHAQALSMDFGGIVTVEANDEGYSIETDFGKISGDGTSVTVESDLGSATVGANGSSFTSGGGGIQIGEDGRVTFTDPGGKEVPGFGGLPFPTSSTKPFEIPIPVPCFKTKPLEIPIPVPSFSTERLPIPITLPTPEAAPLPIPFTFPMPFNPGNFPNVSMTPTPGGPVPIPYPNMGMAPWSSWLASAAGLAGMPAGVLGGIWEGMSEVLGGAMAGGAPPQFDLNLPTIPWLEPPAPWVAEIGRAVARTIAQWQLASRVDPGATVLCNGVICILQPGWIESGIDFRQVLRVELATEGLPEEFAKAVSKVFAEAWNHWFAGHSGTLTYPAFAAFPGPQTPPMPNIPQPLVAAGVSTGWPGMMADELEAGLRDAVPSPGDLDASIRQASRWFSERFSVWCASVMVIGVVTTAPVPSYAPPLVPVGPAVGPGMSFGNFILHGGQSAFTNFGG